MYEVIKVKRCKKEGLGHYILGHSSIKTSNVNEAYRQLEAENKVYSRANCDCLFEIKEIG